MTDLQAAVFDLVAAFPKQLLWFRGQAYRGWPLVPSARREFSLAAEKTMYQLFAARAEVRHSRACPDRRDAGQWFALMQHYGLPTRLLDWSESLLVAAFFATEAHSSGQDGVIWALSPGKLNLLKLGEQCVTNLDGDQIRPALERALLAQDGTDEEYAVQAPQIDMRMMVQQCEYTFHGTARPLEQHPAAESFLRGFIVPASAKHLMREVLHIMGIRRSLLFPDLHNLAADLADLMRRAANPLDVLPVGKIVL